MKALKLAACVLALGLVLASPAAAQFHLAIAPVTGLNFNIHSGSDLDETGTGFGFLIGADAVMHFSPNFGLISGLRFYDNRSASRSRTGTEQGINYTQDISASIAYFQLENLFLLKLPKSQIYFVAGPVIGFNVEASGEVKTTLTTQGAQFQGGGTTQTQKSSIKNTVIRFELKAGAGYDIPVTRDITVAPQLTVGYGITKVVEDVSWRILTIQAAASVKFAIL
jgi:hypothetical protein